MISSYHRTVRYWSQLGGSNVYLAALHGEGVRSVEGLLLVVRSSLKSLLDGTSGVGDHLVPDLLEERSRLPVASLSTSLQSHVNKLTLRP